MGKQFSAIDDAHRAFISRQRIFFAASASAEARVNVSPRGTDCFRILGDTSVAYLDRTGSGNETAAHLLADGRLTLMFCAFDGPPMILRLYGRGEVLSRRRREYADLLQSAFAGEEPAGTRQIVRMSVEMVQTSCGYGVPLFGYEGERPSLDNWARSKTDEEIRAYRAQKNMVSLDGLPTGLVEA
jgi:hypothetical protein